MNDAHELKQLLSNFCGTDQWYRHGLNRNMLYTDGVQAFAENAGHGAYWFLDIVATEVFPIQKDEPFIAITLNVATQTAMITADDGNGTVLWNRNIDYTDCPDGTWKFYLIDHVLLLPSEY